MSMNQRSKRQTRKAGNSKHRIALWAENVRTQTAPMLATEGPTSALAIRTGFQGVL